MTSRSERHTETSAKVPFPCRGVSCQLSRHFSVAVTAAWQRRVFFFFLFPRSWQVKRRMHKHQAAPPMSGHKSTRQCSETHWASRMRSLLTQNHRVGNGLATCPREIECLSARISSVTTTSYICQTLQVPRNTGTMCCTPCAAEPTRSASARCC